MDNQVALLAEKRTPWIRGAREAQGLGLRELERRTGIDRGYLSKIERGIVTPSVPTLKRIAQALGLRDLARQLEPFGGRNGAA